MNDFNDFLTTQGVNIFQALKAHVSKLGIQSADEYELAMLANSFDIYSQNAKYCKDHGTVHEMETKTGTYPMLRPEYNAMKNEYANILKHSAKFGLNPGDRAKIFNMKDKGDKGKKGFDLGGQNGMKAA